MIEVVKAYQLHCDRCNEKFETPHCDAWLSSDEMEEDAEDKGWEIGKYHLCDTCKKMRVPHLMYFKLECYLEKWDILPFCNQKRINFITECLTPKLKTEFSRAYKKMERERELITIRLNDQNNGIR